jgi:ribosomal protein L24E
MNFSLRRVLVVAVLAASVAPMGMGAAGAAVSLHVASLPTTPAFHPSWAPNVRETDASDPDIVRVGSTYYAYTTGTTWGNHIGVLKSSQPNTGYDTYTKTEFGSSAFPQVPTGTSIESWQVNGSQHAPGVFSIEGRYVMWYTAQTVSGHGGHYCLSVATAAAPIGPFSDKAASGPVICDDADGGIIDPSPFVDGSGHPWLYYKTFDDINAGPTPARIWAVPLTSDGAHLAGTPHIILSQNNMSSPFETVENPEMLLTGDHYVLVFSRGLYTSSAYRQGYANCDGPNGPCQEATSTLVTSYGPVEGPGGGTAFTDASGKLWLAYAGWNAPCHQYSGTTCARRLFVAPLAVLGAVPCKAVSPIAGYRMVASDGGIFVFGNQQFCGSTGGISLNSPIVGMAHTKSGGGYWLVASDGGIFAFGDAHFYGSTGAIHLNQPIVGMAATPSGHGYWFVARDGGIFSFGDAAFYGSTGAIHLNQPIVGMAATPSGHGYWLVASDGGIFSFGDAAFHGSTGAIHLNQPIVGMASTPSGHGYWFVARDGGIFSFGDAAFHGSTGAIHLNQPIVGMAATPSGNGYRFVARDGGIFSFGDAKFYGSTGGIHLAQPIVGIS